MQVCHFHKDEKGFALVLALMIMVILTLIGISATRLSQIEIRISGNERLSKKTFYGADGGTETGIELLEENISCPQGFTPNTSVNSRTIVGTETLNLAFWQQEDPPSVHEDEYPSDTYRDITLPPRTGNPPESPARHTNITVFGVPELSTGSAIQIAAGYEGKGKGFAGGGAEIVYDIYSQHLGANDSEAIVRLQWQHIIGQEGDCKY